MASRNEQLLEALLNGETVDIVPQSRNEEILLSALNGTKPTGAPTSRMEAMLQAVCEKGLGTGTGGTGGSAVDNKVWVDASDSVETLNGCVANGIIRYVTFKSYDGAVEYGRKSVIAGETCVDPVANGLMATPTKESTAQYNYTFSGGWATAPNGGKDSNALKNVTEDRTVYANFISAVRYYTVTYYDSDGATVLKTESLAYGTVPSYSPEKDGYTFNKWEPTPAAVNGNTSYTATWTKKVGFAAATWDQIAEACSSGTYTELYNLYDKRTDTITNGDGTQETVEFEIVDMDPSGIISGTHMAILATHTLDTPKQFSDKTLGASEKTSLYYGYEYLFATYLKAMERTLPTDMAAAMQSVTMPYATADGKLHVPTSQMITGSKYEYTGQYYPMQSNMLAAFRNGKTKICNKKDGTAVDWWTASTEKPANTLAYQRPVYINTSGNLATSMSYDPSMKKYVRLLFFV